MKTYINLIIVIALFLTSQKILGNNSYKIDLNKATTVKKNNQSEIPKLIVFGKDQQVSINQFETWISSQFNLDQNVSFFLLNSSKDKLGYTHYRYQQTYNSIAIEGTMLIVHARRNKIESINGDAASVFNIANSPVILESIALQKALTYLPSKKYFWENKQFKNSRTSVNPFLPKGELKIIPANRNLKDLRLCYKFEILSMKPLKGSFIYIDAVTGEKVFEKPAILHIDETGTAETKYSGTQTISTTKNTSGNYILKEDDRGNGIETRDLRTQVDQSDAQGNFTSYDFEDSDNYWNNVNAQLDEAATDAHWGAEMTYDYFFNEHGRNSIDGNGIKLRSYVHLDTDGQANAFWLPNKNSMFYGEGQGLALTFLDVAGHEITHGLTSHSANLVYQGESGALNESFSDIFGKTIEHYARPSNWSWEIGIDGGNALRSMQNPKSKQDPDTYEGSNWAITTSQDDNGGVHTNSGVQNHWYYLLVEGGSGTNDQNEAYQVTGIGWDKAGEIAFRNLTVYLTNNSNYAEARQYSIQAAVDLFGGCSPEVESVTNAWYAVGVGTEFQIGDAAASFTTSTTEGCTTPFDITFQNTSVNGGNSVWDFGDGSKSTDINPTHTYQLVGDFDVQLNVSGNCGADSVIKINHIKIDPDIPCVVNMAISGKLSFSACAGTLYDNGGANGRYANNNDSYFTISPTNATSVSVEFKSFDLESGDQGPGICNYDLLTLYDGPDENSPELGGFCGTNLPQLNTVYQSTGSSITIRLNADPYENGDGFEIIWECEELSTDITKIVDTSISIKNNIITVNGFNDNLNYQITDVRGRIVQQGISNSTIELQNKLTGIYILKLQENTTFKFFVKYD
jgi:Zn-dependent metalloprotease